MPELPEVETVRRQLEPHLAGCAIRRVAVRDPLLLKGRPVEQLISSLQGRTIESVGRRGKYLTVTLDEGIAVIHLRMTGMLEPLINDEDEPPHTRLIMELDSGVRVAFTDTRRFGTVDVFATATELEEYLSTRIGPEPIAPNWTVDGFYESLKRRSTPIKSAILDQRIGCGMGNIYADEALIRAHINPHRAADSLTYRECALLAATMRRVLLDAIEAGGSNIRDYVPPGTVARYQEQHQAYGRGGMPCLACGAIMEKTRIGGRATVHCPTCQPPVSVSAPSTMRA